MGYSIIGHAAITTSSPVSIARWLYADPTLTKGAGLFDLVPARHADDGERSYDE